MSFVAFRHYLTHNPLYLYCLIRQKYRQLRRCHWVDVYARTDRKVPPPLVYKLVLTDKCNLACKMCMNIRERGVPGAQKVHQELDYQLISNLFDQVSRSGPSVILSGGEPMLYHRFPDLIELLERSRISTNICTNGTALAKHLPLLKTTRHINLTVSLDGIRSANDTIRGHGVYDSVVSAIRKLRKECDHHIYIGIQHTIRPENAASMYNFCKEMVELKVDWILLNPCWYMSEDQAKEYSLFMRREYGVISQSQKGYVMDYPLQFDVFAREFAKIRAAKWPLQISCHYRNPVEDARSIHVDQFDRGNHELCYKQWVRMDIMPDGKVVSCQQYPDVTLGDLHQQEWQEIWNSDSFRSFRASILRRPLPVCRKCAPFYLYDGKRMRL